MHRYEVTCFNEHGRIAMQHRFGFQPTAIKRGRSLKLAMPWLIIRIDDRLRARDTLWIGEKGKVLH